MMSLADVYVKYIDCSKLADQKWLHDNLPNAIIPNAIIPNDIIPNAKIPNSR